MKIEYYGESIYDDLSRESSSLDSEKSKGRLNQFDLDIYNAPNKEQKAKRANSVYTDKKITNMSNKEYGAKSDVSGKISDFDGGASRNEKKQKI
jgi:hypothetical protein